MTDTDIATLADTFSYAQARAAGLTKHRVYQLRDSGIIEQIERGLYRRADADVGDLDLIAAASRIPSSTLCLGTALARHGLSDVIASRTDIAIPRGHRRPATPATIQWHLFDPDTFEIGREAIAVGDHLRIGLYSPERCIIDAFRMRGIEGHEQAYEALRRWLRGRGAQPGKLLQMAQPFARAATPLRRALEAML
jgi:predicted transcriptional regulator of viral defense system